MDNDIQDILDSVSAPTVPQRTRDLQALTRAWINERTSPELLPYPTTLVERMTDRIKTQVSGRPPPYDCEWAADRSSADRDNRRNDGYHGSQSQLHSRHTTD